MLIIDPVGNHISGKNSNAETDIRDAISPLNGLADEYECMVFGIRHLSEKEIKAGVLAAILGSSAWVQVAARRTRDRPRQRRRRISHVQCVAGNRLPPEHPAACSGSKASSSTGSTTRSPGRLDRRLVEDVETLFGNGDSRRARATTRANSSSTRSRHRRPARSRTRSTPASPARPASQRRPSRTPGANSSRQAS